MRSRASGAARLDASFCCIVERALALSELGLFPISSSCFRFAPSLDVPPRIARERVQERVPTTSNGGSRPFSPATPDRARERVPKRVPSSCNVHHERRTVRICAE
jgi:hypothetical protein